MIKEGESEKRQCLECGKEFHVPSDARHKKFCSAKHRNDWHLRRRHEALRALEEAEAKK